MMKLDETALEAAAQKFWEFAGREGSFREDTSYPEVWPESAAAAVTAYLEALDTEGLADLYEYWCERIEALPVPDEVREGDTYAYRAGGGWATSKAQVPHATSAYWRVLRRARRQWRIGDLVDDTRDLPEGTVVRDESGDVAEYIAVHDMVDMFHIAGSAGAHNLDTLNNPRIIWLPENGDES